MGKADMNLSYRTYKKIAREDHSKHTRLGSLSLDLIIGSGQSAKEFLDIRDLYQADAWRTNFLRITVRQNQGVCSFRMSVLVAQHSDMPHSAMAYRFIFNGATALTAWQDFGIRLRNTPGKRGFLVLTRQTTGQIPG